MSLSLSRTSKHLTWTPGWWSLVVSAWRLSSLISSHTLCSFLILLTDSSGWVLRAGSRDPAARNLPCHLPLPVPPPALDAGSVFCVGLQRCEIFILFGSLTILKTQDVLFTLRPWRRASGAGATGQPSARHLGGEFSTGGRAGGLSFLLGRFLSSCENVNVGCSEALKSQHSRDRKSVV